MFLNHQGVLIVVIKIKADVIVNSTTNKLELNAGILSKYILGKAGQSIQTECFQNYPSGISLTNDVAITSSGKIDQVKNIFHICCPNYNQQNESVRI